MLLSTVFIIGVAIGLPIFTQPLMTNYKTWPFCNRTCVLRCASDHWLKLGAPNENQTRLRLASNPTRNVNPAQNLEQTKGIEPLRESRMRRMSPTPPTSA